MSLLLTIINVLTPHNHGFLCGALRENVTSPNIFEAFNVASDMNPHGTRADLGSSRIKP